MKNLLRLTAILSLLATSAFAHVPTNTARLATNHRKEATKEGKTPVKTEVQTKKTEKESE